MLLTDTTNNRIFDVWVLNVILNLRRKGSKGQHQSTIFVLTIGDDHGIYTSAIFVLVVVYFQIVYIK